MSAIDDLRRTLQRATNDALRGFQPASCAPLEREIALLRSQLSDGAGGGPLTTDRMKDALKRFYQVERFDGLGHARLVCFGCVEPFGDEQIRLMEDHERFPKLLESTDHFRREPRAFRRCYRGLLSGYISYDPEGESVRLSGKQNWETLRQYLSKRIHDINAPGISPDWVVAIQDHSNLLSDAPCQRYGLGLLRGEEDPLEELRQRLDVSDASWISRKLVVAQIEEATSQNDDEFRQFIEPLLELLEQHVFMLDKGLARILDRYRECANREPHPKLRDFAVNNWKNPRHSSNSAKWGQVGEPARKMVGDWLNLELIQQFFSLLADDGINDTRRLKFWARYHDQIDDMYFALGSSAYFNSSANFRDLRGKMANRLLQLHNCGAPTNNAFIMTIGNHVVVEFGEKGNACFIFEKDSLPFPLIGSVAGNGSGLKHSRHIERLLHIDRKAGSWERQFEIAVQKITSAKPVLKKGGTDRTAGNPQRLSSSTSRTDAAGTARTAARSQNPGSFSEAAFARFVSTKGLETSDRRDRGGALWVLPDKADRGTSRQLTAWGFCWSERKGRWYKNK